MSLVAYHTGTGSRCPCDKVRASNALTNRGSAATPVTTANALPALGCRHWPHSPYGDPEGCARTTKAARADALRPTGARTLAVECDIADPESVAAAERPSERSSLERAAEIAEHATPFLKG
jgi:hypothetical protein